MSNTPAIDKSANTTHENVLKPLQAILSQTIDPDNIKPVLKTITSMLKQHFNIDNAYIYLKDEQGKYVNITHPNNRKDDPEITASTAVINHTLQSAEPIVINIPTGNHPLAADPVFAQNAIVNVICCPIKFHDSTVGVIYADSTSQYTWDNSLLDLFCLCSQALSLLITNMKLRKQADENKRLAAAGKATLKVSHSVKNLLQMVAGAAEVIDYGLKTNQLERVKRSWNILQPNLERLRKFVLDMLDYSKERKLELGPCDFNNIIHSSIESLNSQLKEKASTLKLSIDTTIPIIELDGERIHEMALNIILNAIDIVDPVDGVVIVETKYYPDQQQVELVVSDNGPGLSEEMKQKIFTPFESGKNKFGTGLGMAIAKQIIDQHKGSITIESEHDKGTTFKVRLPAKIIAS